MNAALQAALSELFLDLIAAIGAVGPHVRSRVARIENIFELLTVCPLASLTKLSHANLPRCAQRRFQSLRLRPYWLSLDLAICSFDPNFVRIRICIAEWDVGRIATRTAASKSL
jgi:hypothetical protein